MAKDKEVTKFDAHQWYLSNFEMFEASLNGHRENGFQTIRRNAISKFSELGFPTPRDESWKYTNVAPILKYKFNHGKATTGEVSEEVLNKVLFRGLENNRLVFLNGHYQPAWSTFESKDGVVITNLQSAFAEHSDIVAKHLGTIADFDEESFVALNTAFTHDGLFVHIARNVIYEAPIQIVYLTEAGESDLITHPRTLIIAEQGSDVTLIESFHTVNGGNTRYFNNSVAEVFVGENAHVEHLRIQDESHESFHVSNRHVRQAYSSNYTTLNVDLGGRLVRNNLNIELNGENCESHLFGFFLGTGSRHIDNQTFVDHAVPNCFSNELYKGILDDKARGVFNGRILVRQDAQKTNALQSNKTLLLTNEASINAKPQLEIFADDVKCTHGATIGQLDDEALFYLRARGISESVASAMLRHAFASDVFDEVRSETLRAELNERVLDHLSSTEKGQ